MEKKSESIQVPIQLQLSSDNDFIMNLLGQNKSITIDFLQDIVWAITSLEFPIVFKALYLLDFYSFMLISNIMQPPLTPLDNWQEEMPFLHRYVPQLWKMVENHTK